MKERHSNSPGGPIGDMDIGTMLRRQRKLAGLSQGEVGKMIGKSKSVVSQYETGRLKITFENVQRFCDALGITVRDLFFEEAESIFPGEQKGEITERLIRKILSLSDDDRRRLVGYIDALGGD